MKLIDNEEFKKLLVGLSIEDTVSGGSVANSIVGLSQLGDKTSFIGKINDDELGQKYEEGLRKENVINFLKKQNIPVYGIWGSLKNKNPNENIKNFKGIFKKLITINNSEKKRGVLLPGRPKAALT